MPFTGGPYVITAALCDQALQDKDGSISLVRVIDKVTGHGVAEQMPSFTANIVFVLILTAGEAAGQSFTVNLQMNGPSGEMYAGIELPVRFGDSPNARANLIVKLALQVASPGLHWVRVLLEDELLTRTPLLAEYDRVTPAPQGPVPG